MITVSLKPLTIDGKECIGIYFDSHSAINGAIRKHAGARWDPASKAWWVLLSRDNYYRLLAALNGKAAIDQQVLFDHYEGRNREKKLQGPVNDHGTVVKTGKDVALYSNPRIDPVNAHVLPLMRQQLILIAYSVSTIKTYINEMAQLLLTIKNIPADDLTPEHLRRYLVYCFEKLKLTENTLHSRINAMKFYYEQVLGREKFFWEIPRPKKHFILPKVLGESELRRLFNALQNKKHKAILFTAYSAGLRVSEVVNLELKHIDRSRMQLLVQNAKGKKDRYVMLSPLLLDILTNYYKTACPKPRKYVFEGPEAGTCYSASSMQRIFQTARKSAGIRKDVTFHSLRHSFATHLLEKGIDIKYIRDLLGHFDIRTTTRYLHVRKEQLVNIESPLDHLISRYEI
jgi:integrase/recombinase XerD